MKKIKREVYLNRMDGRCENYFWHGCQRLSFFTCCALRERYNFYYCRYMYRNWEDDENEKLQKN